MKFIHILENINSGLDEAPMGLINRGIAKIGSAIPGTIGNQYSGEIQVGKIANNLYYEFYRFLGQIGGKPTGNAIKQFLKTKNTDADITRFLPPAAPTVGGLGGGPDPANMPLSSGQVEKIFLGVVQDAARGGPPAGDAPPAPVPPVPPTPPTGGGTNVNDILTAIGNGSLKRRDLNRLKRKIDTILGTP